MKNTRILTPRKDPSIARLHQTALEEGEGGGGGEGGRWKGKKREEEQSKEALNSFHHGTLRARTLASPPHSERAAASFIFAIAHPSCLTYTLPEEMNDACTFLMDGLSTIHFHPGRPRGSLDPYFSYSRVHQELLLDCCIRRMILGTFFEPAPLLLINGFFIIVKFRENWNSL